MRSSRRSLNRLVGIVVVAALALGLSGCTALPGRTITVTALMGDSAGLFVGNDVGVLGVPVGTVTSIKPEGTHVRVTMSIDRDQPVPADAGAVVVARSVATDRYVELTPVYHSGPRMRDGAVIQQQLTRTPVDFDEVLEALNDFATGIAGQKGTRNAIANILREGSQAVDGKGALFNRAVTSLGGAVDSISGQREDIAGTVKSLDTLTSTVASHQQLVRDFVTQVSQASTLLADERGNFRSAMRALGRAVALVADFAHQNRQQLVRAVDQSSGVMRSILTKRDDLTEILRVMPVTLQNLQATLHHGRVRVRVDPLVLTPLPTLLKPLCNATQTDFCSLFGPSLLNLQNLIDLLTGKQR
ncbi:phospholipid/cholesterol/gamma-HCH transport system substrate-binding protein [Marmoricola sp. URHA0025 HA25]